MISIKKIQLSNCELHDVSMSFEQFKDFFSNNTDISQYKLCMQGYNDIDKQLLNIDDDIIDEQTFISRLQNDNTSDNTIKNYTSILNKYKVFDNFNYDDIIKKINAIYSHQTQKSHYSALLKYLNVFNLQNDKQTEIKNKLSDLRKQVSINNSEKPTDEIQNAIKKWNLLIDEYKKILSEHNFKTYDKYLSLLHFFIYYGILRPSELAIIYISYDDDETKDGCISINKKQLIIRKHKTVKSTGTRIINLKDDFINLIKNNVNNYLFTNSKNKQHTANSINKLLNNLFKKYDCTLYDLRKIKTSLTLKTNDIEAIKTLENIQGHNLKTQLEYYKTYA